MPDHHIWIALVIAAGASTGGSLIGRAAWQDWRNALHRERADA